MYKADTLLHFFYPSYSNNHRAKALHNTSLLVIVFMLFLYQILLQSFPYSGLKILGYAANISSSEVISLTNKQRESYGLSSLVYSSTLEQAANLKGQHMLENDYWAHVAPDGTEPWFFFTDSGYKYRYAGENLARDFSNPESAVEAWMSSPSHKENLLSGKYQEIGVAVVEGDLNGVDTTIIVQLFGTRLDTVTAQIPVAQAKPQATSAPVPSLVAIVNPTVAPVIAQISPQPTSTGEKILKATEPVKKDAGGFQLLISPFDTTKRISLITLGILIIIMVIDGVVIAKKKIARVGGRSFAHIAFMGMVISLILIAKAGEIL